MLEKYYFIIIYLVISVIRKNSMQSANSKSALVFGSTGLLGYHVTNRLLDEKYKVTVFVRSREKLQKIFKDKIQQFQRIVEGSLDDQDKLESAFFIDNKKTVNFVISVLGAGPQSKHQVERVQYTNQVNIVWKCQKHNVQKFVLVSAALIQRPWHPITAMLNTIVPNVYHWKVQLENDIRRSNLRYIIIRPPQLYGNIQDETLKGYRLDQGDKIIGKISRFTQAKVLCDSLKSNEIAPRVTYECNQVPLSQQHKYPSDFSALQSDRQDKIIRANHIGAKNVYWVTTIVIVLGIIGSIGYLIFK